MLQRIYIDNYKCMVNFELKPKPMQLLVGLNGSGKSTVFEVLAILRHLVTGGRTVGEVFPSETLTRWQLRREQTFELEVAGNGGVYAYRLEVEHNPPKRQRRIRRESLTYDGHPLYSFDGMDAQLYRDDYSEGPRFPFDWSRSGLPGIPTRTDNPPAMRSRTEDERPYPEGDLADFVSWYRSLSQESLDSVFALFGVLKKTIEGFASLKLMPDGEQGRVLRVAMEAKPGMGGMAQTVEFRFDELSDGERALIVLYALSHFAVGPDATLCLDEPGNWLALPEVQPWLVSLRERVEQQGSQAILSSHSPEVIDYLAPDSAVRLQRLEGGPVRVRDLALRTDARLSASQMIARGWDDEA